MWEYIPWIVVAIVGVIVVLSGLKTIRPTHVAAIETLGKYTRQVTSGLVFVIPIFQRLISINITEQLVDVARQDVITKENLNCQTDAQVYYKVGATELEMKNALYNVQNVEVQMIQLAKSTLRAVIGQKMFKEVNSQRQDLNTMIFKELEEQTKNWGVKVVRVELKEIFPPQHVQDTMDKIIMAENTKDAQVDLAKAKAIEADGDKQRMVINAQAQKESAILAAEADKQARILQSEAQKEVQRITAEGEKQKIELQAQAEKTRQELVAAGQANAIQAVANANAAKYKVEGESLKTNFTDSAIKYKELDTIQNSLSKNSKFLITDGHNPLTLILNDKDGHREHDIIPIPSEPPRIDSGSSTIYKPAPESTQSEYRGKIRGDNKIVR